MNIDDTTTDTDTTDTTDTTVDDTVDTSADDTDTTDTTDTSADDAADDTSADDDSTVLGDKSGDDDTSDDDDDDKAEAGEGAPETYELSLTDDDGNAIELDAELVAEADPILRELNLSNEQANKLVGLAPKMMAKGQMSAIEQLNDAGAKQKQEWLKEGKAAEDIGGANWEESIKAAAVGLDAMGFKEGTPFRKLMNETGLGNHPDMIRTFKTLGEVAGEDGTFARSSATSETQPAGWDDRYKD